MLSPMQRRKIQSSAAAIQSGYDTLAGWIDGTMSQTTPDGHGDDGSQEPAGFAWSLYHHTLNLFSLLLSPMLEHVATFSSPYDKQSEKSLKKSLGRLFLWGGSFEGGKLESVLDESESLKETVMESLAAIGKILLFKIPPKCLIESNASEDPRIKQEMHDLSIWVEKARIITDNGYESDDSSASTDISENLSTFISSLGTYVGGLMELLPSMEEILGSLDWQEIDDHPSQSIAFQISGPAQPYVLKVYDKFPLADMHLMHRLGEANWQRHMSLRAMDNQQETELPQELPKITFVAVSEFQDSGLGSSLPARSSYAATIASHSSFQTTAEDKDSGNLKVPPTPKQVSDGEPFNCSICGNFLTNIKNRVDWRRHVFSDLKPYLCTFPGCEDEYKTFATRKLWEEHEFGQHRLIRHWVCATCQYKAGSPEDWRAHLVQAHQLPLTEGRYPLDPRLVEVYEPISVESLSCPLCLIVPGKSQRNFATHVGRHMEDIALAALPRDGESTDTESNASDMPDTADSWSLSTLPLSLHEGKSHDGEDFGEHEEHGVGDAGPMVAIQAARSANSVEPTNPMKQSQQEQSRPLANTQALEMSSKLRMDTSIDYERDDSEQEHRRRRLLAKRAEMDAERAQLDAELAALQPQSFYQHHRSLIYTGQQRQSVSSKRVPALSKHLSSVQSDNSNTSQRPRALSQRSAKSMERSNLRGNLLQGTNLPFSKQGAILPPFQNPLSESPDITHWVSQEQPLAAYTFSHQGPQLQQSMSEHSGLETPSVLINRTMGSDFSHTMSVPSLASINYQRMSTSSYNLGSTTTNSSIDRGPSQAQDPQDGNFQLDATADGVSAEYHGNRYETHIFRQEFLDGSPQSHPAILKSSDGVQKRNSRFDIPTGRTLESIDHLIAQSNDEEEIKELKQQQRLLRNRQAALDSRSAKLASDQSATGERGAKINMDGIIAKDSSTMIIDSQQRFGGMNFEHMWYPNPPQYANPWPEASAPSYNQSLYSSSQSNLHSNKGLDIKHEQQQQKSPVELVKVDKDGKAIPSVISPGADSLNITGPDLDRLVTRLPNGFFVKPQGGKSTIRSMGQNRNTSVAAFTPLSCGWAGCNKEFKRACDLTMHEKTHSRPWKCPDKSCKYHEIGWPTEKELDRHHRDKHDALQPVFKCHYKPCPYQSKRESNCKQHMEKAHGWTYVRSKNKGKVRVAVPVANNGMVYDPEAPLLSYSTSPTIKSSMAGSGIIDNHHAYPSALSPAHNAYAPTPTAHETMGYHPAPVRSTYAIQKDNNDNSRRLL